MSKQDPDGQPRYIISVAATLASCHPQTLRHYERIGLVTPERSPGNLRLYTDTHIEQLRRIQRLMDDLGVNLAAVEVILHMRQQIVSLREEMADLQRRVNELERGQHESLDESDREQRLHHS